MKKALRAFLANPRMSEWKAVQQVMFGGEEGRFCLVNPANVQRFLFVCQHQIDDDTHKNDPLCPFDGVNPNEGPCGKVLLRKTIKEMLEPCIKALADLEARFPDKPGRRGKVKK